MDYPGGVNVTELRCTSCLAPIDPARGSTQRCVYCGTTLQLGGTAGEVGAGPLRLEECGPNKIGVIRIIREITGLGLKEAKELAESAPCVLGESIRPEWATMFRAQLEAIGARVSGGGGPATHMEVSPGHVLLEHCGDNIIAVIKVIREHTGLGLREAKDLAQSAPCTIEPRLPRPRSLREELLLAGARVR